ncbi:saccharopine dehydrogenase NADP-binding domain-containing protein [Pseudomonas sp. UBA4194]|uniref:saccharopine dehydrogenase NADP-binding domain-containing protein n=1 Tax=Pseudomonas sp. UBA4194 TaxID=1947317 RepID=UPI0025DDDA32|nr:saccharopine dehydrogenase NADP-binding domain-containing protein [Pseudomonas sp. UBA4194]
MKLIEHIVIVGFGSIAQALLPLLRRQYTCDITILEKIVDARQEALAVEYSVNVIEVALTADNFEAILSSHLSEQTFLLNLAVSVSSVDLIRLAQSHGALYLDTCIEPWGYAEEGATLTSNFALRERMKEMAAQMGQGFATAIVAHGANPGFISVLLKKALIDMAMLNDVTFRPHKHEEWAILAQALGVRVIQISERDTQVSFEKSPVGQFLSTWSVDGLITECLQPAEMGWGSHEGNPPRGSTKNGYSVAMKEQGCDVLVKSWSPNALEFQAYLLTHNESLSIAEYLTIGDHVNPAYRPTVYYAYHPCDQAVKSIGLLRKEGRNEVVSKKVLMGSVVSGIDELGVFLISDIYSSYWLGSNLSIGKARKMAKYNNATSLQVVSSVLAGMAWAQAHPAEGLVESEKLDWQAVYEFAKAYWEPLVSQETNWAPTQSQNQLLFENFRVLEQR